MGNLNFKYTRLLISCLVIVFLYQISLSGQEDLKVLNPTWMKYSNAPNSFYLHLSERALFYLRERDRSVSEIKTPDDWRKRQDNIRRALLEIPGPFPAKTPLNARVVRTVNKERFRIEHIIFESQPGFYVTSSLFIPAGMKRGTKAPAIIYCSGHSASGYRSAPYQQVILNLVLKGFIVYAFDPTGQGERLGYFNPVTGKSDIGGPTLEHSYPGAQAYLTGSSQAMFMIWDGIRAVDYLLTRKEVDPARIGITGRSGGGTQSAYIAAYDDRIYAAAPENYITNFTRLIENQGPQDAEQNFRDILVKGLDQPDLLIVRAPKPALMITTSNDIFSIQGAMETETQVSRIFEAFGKPENFSRCEDIAVHTSTLKNREALYAFFRKHLGNPGSIADEKAELLSDEDLKVTATGQVSTSLNSETVFSINKKRADELRASLSEMRKNKEAFLAEAINAAKKMSGYIPPDKPGKPILAGKIARENYLIEKYIVAGEGNYVMPYLLFRPSGISQKAIIYIHPAGKEADSAPGGEIEKLIKEGFVVLAPDLIGTGETGPGMLRSDAFFNGAPHNLWYAAIITGRTLAGIRAGDIVRLAMILHDYHGIDKVSGLAKGEMCPVMLYAAAFDMLIEKATLVNPCMSYYLIASERNYAPELIMNAVPGALEKYDLTDLADYLTPERITVVSPVDARMNVLK